MPLFSCKLRKGAACSQLLISIKVSSSLLVLVGSDAACLTMSYISGGLHLLLACLSFIPSVTDCIHSNTSKHLAYS